MIPMLKTGAFAMIALTVCISLTFGQGQPKVDFYPLKVGHRWTYIATDLKAGQAKADKQQRVVVEVEREEIYVEKLTVQNKAIEEKHVGFLLKSTSGGKTTHDFVLFTEKGLDVMDKEAKEKDPDIRSKGLFRVHTAGIPMYPPLKILSFPYYDKDKWIANSASGNSVMKGASSTNVEAVKVPFGSFPQALHVAYRDQQKGDLRIEIDYWFANNVGMIKQRVLSKDHEVLLELEKFEPAK
jgi:hypothetical protein